MQDRADIFSGRIEQYTGMNESVRQQMLDADTVQKKIDLLTLAIYQSRNMKNAYESDGFKSLPANDENKKSFVTTYAQCKKNLKKLRVSLGEDLVTIQQEINKDFDALNIINEFSPELHLDEYAVGEEFSALDTRNRAQALLFIKLRNHLALIASLKELDQLVLSENLKAKIKTLVELEEVIHAHLNNGIDIGQMVLDYGKMQALFLEAVKQPLEDIQNTLRENINNLSNLSESNAAVKKMYIDITTLKSERLLQNKKAGEEKVLSHHQQNKIALKKLEISLNRLNQEIDGLAERMPGIIKEKITLFTVSNDMGEKFNDLHDAVEKQLDACQTQATQNEENITACNNHLSHIDGCIVARNRDCDIQNLHGIDGEKFAAIKDFVIESEYFRKIENYRQHTKGRKKDYIAIFSNEVRRSRNLNELMILISPAYRQEHDAENAILQINDMGIKELDDNLRRTTSTLGLYSLFTSYKSTTDKYMKHLQTDMEAWLDREHGLKIT